MAICRTSSPLREVLARPAFPAFCGGLPDVTADGGGRRPFQFGLLACCIMVLFDDRRRGLHDRIARTVVIDAPETETPVRRRRARRSPA
jgi:uncharacterized RDD family membrane protein YckC